MFCTVVAIPFLGIRPTEGLMLKILLKDAGIETEPSISVPIPKALSLNACIQPSLKTSCYFWIQVGASNKSRSPPEDLPTDKPWL